MTARKKPLYLYLVTRSGGSLTMHCTPVARQSALSYYVAERYRDLYGFRIQVPKAKAHLSMKAAWQAMRDELIGAVLYHRAGMSVLNSLLAQIPKGIPRQRKKAA